jgi:hypothetical protein
MQIKTQGYINTNLLECLFYQKTKFRKAYGQKEPLCTVRIKVITPLQKTGWKFLKILRVEIEYHSGIPILHIYLKKIKLGSQRHLRLHVHCNISYNNQCIKTI